MQKTALKSKYSNRDERKKNVLLRLQSFYYAVLEFFTSDHLGII